MVKPSVKSPESYESALRELEGLLASLESGQLPLEQSIEAYRRGAFLLGYCQSQLADAEQRIKVLEGEMLQEFQGNEPAR
ncbi:MAG: exodeoxyribonuclease VII small subunit [Betaproteobacteria bacterium]|nr:exodeoxyribonuclease VII small subunit [Betaproteobacteria bacterium]